MSVILATAGFDHKIRFWEAPSGRCSRVIKFPDSQVNRLQITPDKQFIAAAGNPHIRLYEIINTPAVTDPHSVVGGGTGGPGGGGGGPGPGGSAGGGVGGVDPPTQQPVLTLEGHTAAVTSIGFQKDGRYLYSGSEDGTIKVWDLRNPNYSRSFDSKAGVNCVTLRTDRDEFISGDQNGYVKVWDLGGNGCLHSVKPSSVPVADDIANNTDPNIGGSSNNPAVHLPHHHHPLPPPPHHHHPHPHPHHYHPGTTIPVVVPPDGIGGTVGQQQLPQHLLQQQQQHQQQRRRMVQRSYHEGTVPIQAVDISEDSRTIVACSNHGTVFVWKDQQQQQQQLHQQYPIHHHDDVGGPGMPAPPPYHPHHHPPPPPGPGGVVPPVPLAPPAGGGVSSSTTAEILSQPLYRRFRAHNDIRPGNYLLHGKMAPDGRHFVTTGSDGYALLWNTTTWECAQKLRNQKWVYDAAFCADSSYLVTASSDNIARLWNLRTGDVVRQYAGDTCVALNDSQ